MQANAEDDGSVFGIPACVLHGLLELDCRRQSVDRAGKLCQNTIASKLDQPAAVAGECRFQALYAMLAQARERAALIAPHQAGIADNVGGEDCR